MSVSKKKVIKSGGSAYEKKVAIKGDFHQAMKFLADSANKKVADKLADASKK